eukprot:COSAG01_NODE_3996_length_5448_cov_24.489250_2_plen_83_part_00
MHPLHYWPGCTQKFLNPRTGRAALSGVLIGWTNGLLADVAALILQAATSANRLYSRSKLPKAQRAPFWCIVPFYGCMCAALL